MSNTVAQSQKESTVERRAANQSSGFLSLALTTEPWVLPLAQWQMSQGLLWDKNFKCQESTYTLSGIKQSSTGPSTASPAPEWASHSLQQRASRRHHTAYIRQTKAIIQQDTPALSQPGGYCPDAWTLDLLITILQDEGYPELCDAGG